MKTLFLVLVGYLFPYMEAAAQQNPAENRPTQYLEGARLVIDILKLFKQEQGSSTRNQRQERHSDKQRCDFCLVNSDTVNKIKVTLVPRSPIAADTAFLVIGAGEKACSLQLTCGVYNCKIQFAWDEVISWGDIYVQSKLVQVERTASRTHFPNR